MPPLGLELRQLQLRASALLSWTVESYRGPQKLNDNGTLKESGDQFYPGGKEWGVISYDQQGLRLGGEQVSPLVLGCLVPASRPIQAHCSPPQPPSAKAPAWQRTWTWKGALTLRPMGFLGPWVSYWKCSRLSSCAPTSRVWKNLVPPNQTGDHQVFSFLTR